MLKMYTTHWCADCRRAKQFLAQHGIVFQQIDIESDPDAAEIVVRHNRGKRSVPTFDRDGHFFSCSPFDPGVLRRELGLK